MQTQMINLSIPVQLLNALDKTAVSEAKTRSEALRDAVRAYVKTKRDWSDVFATGAKKANGVNIKEDQVEEVVDQVRLGK